MSICHRTLIPGDLPQHQQSTDMAGPATSVTAHLECVQLLEAFLSDRIKYMKYKSLGTLGELCPTILLPFAPLVANETAALWFQASTYF